MSVSLSGLVSGINVQQLISNLSAAYQQPIKVLENQQQSYQTTLSAWGTLQSSLSSLQSSMSSLQNLSSVNNRSVSLSNTNAATATVSANAAAGSYSLSNIVLAQSQSIYSQDFSSASSAAVGTGTLQIQVGSGAVTNVVVGSSNNTLDGIASAINSANTGVNAAVVYDGTGYRLTLTGTGTGASSAFSVTTSGATGSLANLSYSSSSSGSSGMILSQAAQNAGVSINGLAVTSASNTISGAIPGVSLNLLQASGSTTLTVSASNTAFVGAVQSFTTAFNKTMGTINQLTAYNAQAGSGGPLLGDASVQGLRTQLLNLISGQGVGVASGSAYNSLGSVGLGLTSSGTINLNTSTLSTALNSNFNNVAGLFGQVGSTSDANVQYIGANKNTQAGTYALNVSQAATQATVSGSVAVPTSGIAQSESLTISSGSSSVVVSLASGSSIANIVNTINDTLQQSGVTGLTASNQNGYLQIQSNIYGSSQSFSVVSNVAAGASGTGIGTSSLAASGTDVVGTVNAETASGVGQNLTVTGPGKALGLQLQVMGSVTGNLGTVTVSQGLYQQMNSLLTQALNSQNGFVAAAQNGIASSINGLSAQITTLQQSASNQTSLLTQQFAAMQSQLSQLQSIGQYLNAFYSNGSSSSSSSSSTGG